MSGLISFISCGTKYRRIFQQSSLTYQKMFYLFLIRDIAVCKWSQCFFVLGSNVPNVKLQCSSTKDLTHRQLSEVFGKKDWRGSWQVQFNIGPNRLTVKCFLSTLTLPEELAARTCSTPQCVKELHSAALNLNLPDSDV